MHADLKWLAENVSEWGGTYGFKYIFLEDGEAEADYSSEPCGLPKTFTRAQWQAARDDLFTQKAAQRQRPNIKTQVTAWRAAEDEILASEMGDPDNPFTTPDEEEAWREVEKKINPVWQSPSPHDFGGVCVFHGCRYSAYEQCPMCVLAREAAKEEAKQARYQDATGEDWIDEAARTFTAEEFRGAMRFTIGKYNRRMGKKDDLIKEIEKMRDYCQRWIDVEKGR
jgi:hypothetical protein